VVLKRKVATDGEGQLDGVPVEPGTYVYERGSNVERGEQLFCAGERLSPKDALLLRDVGCSSIPVYEPFSVGILATGTEMVELTNHVDLGHVDSVLPVYENTFDPSVLSSSTRASRADDFVLTTSRLDEGETVNVTSYSSFS
jgi:molybdopterin biosynthesis enzyme